MTPNAYHHRGYDDHRTDWMADALCAQADPETFFPDKGGNPQPAIEVCLRCPVRQQCLEFALENNMGYGVWGGVTAHARRDLRRMREVPARPAWECRNGHDTRELGRTPSGKCRACHRNDSSRYDRGWRVC